MDLIHFPCIIYPWERTFLGITVSVLCFVVYFENLTTSFGKCRLLVFLFFLESKKLQLNVINNLNCNLIFSQLGNCTGIKTYLHMELRKVEWHQVFYM